MNEESHIAAQTLAAEVDRLADAVRQVANWRQRIVLQCVEERELRRVIEVTLPHAVGWTQLSSSTSRREREGLIVSATEQTAAAYEREYGLAGFWLTLAFKVVVTILMHLLFSQVEEHAALQRALHAYQMRHEAQKP